jgi:tRNA uridine 5-carboxymethylaminomethyl modification enzyme
VARRGELVSRETLAADLGPDLANTVIEQVEIAIKYAGYIGKQVEDVERAAHFEHLKLPADLDYNQVPALSFEVRQKLSRHRPETLGQASRISGVTPAAMSLLLVHLKKGRFAGFVNVPAAAPTAAPQDSKAADAA